MHGRLQNNSRDFAKHQKNAVPGISSKSHNFLLTCALNTPRSENLKNFFISGMVRVKSRVVREIRIRLLPLAAPKSGLCDRGGLLGVSSEFDLPNTGFRVANDGTCGVSGIHSNDN